MLFEVIQSHVLPFESFVVLYYLQMQSFFMDQLHEQKFNLFLTNVTSDVVWTHLRSCACPVVGAWLLVHPNTLSFHLSFAHFFITLCIRFNIPYPTILHFSRCKCGHIIDDLGIHLRHCSCESERITTHETFWNTIATIILESGTHVQKEVFHLYSYHTQKQVDIVITKDNFRTLANIVIVDLICTNLVQCALTMTMHGTTFVIQYKAWSYTKRTQGDDFIPLAIDLWMSPSSFWFLSNFLCTCLYNLPLSNLLQCLYLVIGYKCR